MGKVVAVCRCGLPGIWGHRFRVLLGVYLEDHPRTCKWVVSPIYNPFTLPETNGKSHLKMDGWNTFSFPFGVWPIFRGKLAVSRRVGHLEGVPR